MTGHDFSDWLKRMNLSAPKAAEQFGVNQQTIYRWKQNTRLDRVVVLACRAIEAGLKP